jgi:hypothetical protein
MARQFRSPPVFVLQLANGAVWGLVKFLATLSGLIAAAATKDVVGSSSPFKLTLTIITAAIMGTTAPLAGATFTNSSRDTAGPQRDNQL